MRLRVSFLSLFFIFLFLPSVLSEKVTINNPTTVGLTLESNAAVREFLVADQSFNVNLHVYNSSGFLLDNSSTSCFIHFYNVSGRHLFEASMPFVTANADFEYVVNASFLRIGYYTLLIHCNNTEVGFLSTNLEATSDGLPRDFFGFGWLPIILGLVGLSFLFFFVSSIMRREQLEVLKALLFVFGFVNAFFAGWALLLAVLNPARVDLADAPFKAYFGVSVLMVMLFVWLYGFEFVKRLPDLWSKFGRGGRG